MTTKELLLMLVNGRQLPVRLTRKQLNWLVSVAHKEVEKEGDLGASVWIQSPSSGAYAAGYADVATIYVIRDGEDKNIMFKQEFNGSGLVYH